LLCEYNKDGDSYRSPWTNQYFPPIPAEEDYQPIFPSAQLLGMEQKANEVFQRYAKLYYDNNFHTSVYFFDTDMNGFGCCWLLKKQLKNSQGIDDGTWDAVHSATVTIDDKQKVRYRVISTVFLFLDMSNSAQGKVDMGGHINKVREETFQMDAKADPDQFHIRNIGKLVEQNEADIRGEMQGVYLNKSKQIINTGRLREEYMNKDEKASF
jgi:capping protein beta